MGFAFDIERLVASVAHLFRMDGLDRMEYMKILKLLYYADRESLKDSQFPITGDTPYAMKRGPVLSRTYDFIKTDRKFPLPYEEEEIWREYFTTDGYDLIMLKDPGDGALSRHDERILTAVYNAHRGESGFDMSEESHSLPEWSSNFVPGSSRPIPLRDILVAIGIDNELASAVEEEQRQEQLFHTHFR